MLIAHRRKYVHKTLRGKCQSLKDLEKGLSNKDVAAKYGVPKNTLSTWVESKEKLFAALEKGNNVKRQNLRTRDIKWFLSLRSQNVPLSGAIIQEKAGQYAKELSIGFWWLVTSMEEEKQRHLQNNIWRIKFCNTGNG